MKIQVILGSTRPGRLGDRVAKWVTQTAQQQPDFEVELVDMADYPLEHLNEAISPRFNPSRKPEGAVAKWLTKVGEADGYVIVTPEYNHSISAILKDGLDYLDFQFVKKPVAIVSYGSVGGARAAEHLKSILIEVKAAVVPEAVALMGASTAIAEDGSFTGDTSSPYGPDKALVKVLEELAWWTRTLKNGRQ
ncbi:MAG TPA: NAD(P)H-dependent oxidoreductase [Candidatus Saccharimonadia bacterium]|nr:NAD(P)H-dependent oxidoreductase [Candidatus Saccharimonadia bacterium]